MNGLGISITIIALSLFIAKWFYTWRAGRRVMREMRQQNKRESVSALVGNWKTKDKASRARKT